MRQYPPDGLMSPCPSRSVTAVDGAQMGQMIDEAVADLCPLLAPDVTEERHLIPGAAEPTVILLRQGGGLGRTVQASTAVAALAGVADGELSVGQVASAVAALSELNAADALALRAEMVEATRHLLTTGFLRPGK